MNAPVRRFEAKPAVRGEEPLSVGMIGPPGGGKTFSALRLAKGMQAVRGGDIIVIDTESGRTRKYADLFKFKHVDFQPPFKPSDFLDAIHQQLASNPAAVVVDSLSDEHEGEGGYLDWHDEMVPKSGGNEWAAWSKPAQSRKRLITGILHILTPLIFTFRAREKTAQTKENGKVKVVNIGWQPVAPLAIVHALDLTCILPPRADGVPIWKSDKIGEDFIIKFPVQFQKLFTGNDVQLDENVGRQLAEWAKGGQASPRQTESAAAVTEPAGEAPSSAAPAGEVDSDEIALLDKVLADAAERGSEPLKISWGLIPAASKPVLKSALDRRHKPRAAEVDAAR